ncbi:GMP synthase-like glutamine amidotransferase [Dyadobacter jejuensis]|uniref:GMP synthase-like glutamine amidotransferase n=1 Tax=Dyadobacter jejuensis TaxID=1082580 RepID=A0A316APH9_9BACT|nr:amidotransferase [Dyadobacter jejuensis]PWJ59401.1 GMP synthase-like glutamine amidotransferase [Dyadobacter jejuensis]
MRIGLLECDHVREDFRDISGDYSTMFPELFLKVAPDWEFVFYDVVNDQFPHQPNECDAYICTGSSYSVYEEQGWIYRLKIFALAVMAQGRKFVGVCFGHQLLGEVLGGVVEKSEVGWCVGVHAFDLLAPQPWMEQATKQFNLLMMCQDQILQLPPGAHLLAASEQCPHAMFQYKDHGLGIQGHPEFTKPYTQALLADRVARIGAQRVEDGQKSLELNTDELLFALWVKNFMEAKR